MQQMIPIPLSDYPNPDHLQACTHLLDQQQVYCGVFLLPDAVLICRWDGCWSLEIWEAPLGLPGLDLPC